ncbi:MAG: sulfite exporter TauE/SafE family protein, partial [Hyphomicrobiaceae bacterium]
GWYLAAVINDQHVKLMVGTIGFLFAANWWLGLRPRSGAPEPNWLKGSLFGAISGFTSFVSHTGGPPFAVYMLPQRLANTVYVGTSVMFFTAVNLIKVPPYLFLGQFDAINLKTALVLMIPGMLAMAAGIWLTRRVSQGAFYEVVYGCLLLISMKLIWDGGRNLIG